MTKLSECNTVSNKIINSKEFEHFAAKLTKQEKKQLIDSLVDPIFVIMNANNHLKEKLEYFLDEDTRERFYMIDRAQKRISNTIFALKSTLDDNDLA